MALLIVVEGPNQGKTFQVSALETLGSDNDCSIVLRDRRVASTQAEIRKRRTGGCEIRNLQPRKNILVNGEIIDKVLLQHGDWVTIADTTLVFSEDTEAQDRPSIELQTIDPDDLLRSQIQTRRRSFEDADSVLESMEQSGSNIQYDNRLRTLYRVTHELCQIMDLRLLIDRLTSLCMEIFDADRVFVLMKEEGSNRLRPMGTKTRGAQRSHEFSKTIVKEVYRSKEAILCCDVTDDERFLSGQSIVDQDLVSFMCVPLLNQGQISGVLQVNSSEQREAFDQHDLELLSAIAMQVGVLIEKSRDYRRRQEHNQLLHHLGRATQQLSSFLQQDRILKEAVRISCKILNCTKASVMLSQPDGKLKVSSVQGMTPDAWAGIDRNTLGDRFVRRVIEDASPLLIQDIRELDIEPRERYLSHSLLIVPIISSLNDGAQPIGAISVTDKVGTAAFSGNDQKILSILAGQVAITLKNADLYEKATVDALTRVYVRRFFDIKLEEEMELATDKERSLSLLMLDIDHFKQVNDQHKHQAGDMVLRGFAALVKKCVRPSDYVARYGGEEFSVILKRADSIRASRVAERIRKAIEASEFRIPEGTLKITVSIGSATLKPGEPPAELVKRADHALYAAKNNGRNQCQRFDSLSGSNDAAPTSSG
jgi:eukaryotic-like serine/threonine-protein kinase